MTRVIIHGSYFSLNFGDVLLWRSAAERVRLLLNGSEIYHCDMPVALRKFYLRDFPDLSLTRRVRGADVVVFCGGGYFMPPHRYRYIWELRNLMRHQLALRIAKSAGRVGFFGVGLGEVAFPPFRRLLSKAIENADLLVLRDVESVEALRHYGKAQESAHVTPDLAFVDVYNKAKTYNLPKEYVGIHADFKGMSQEKLALFLQSCDGIMKLLPLESRFLVDCPSRSAFESISVVKQRFPSLSKAVVSVFDGSPDRFLEQISRCAVIVTTKLHVGICATAMGTPVVSIAKHPKTKRFYSQFGLSACCPESTQELISLVQCFDRLELVAFPPEIVAAGKEALSLFDQFIAGAVR